MKFLLSPSVLRILLTLSVLGCLLLQGSPATAQGHSKKAEKAYEKAQEYIARKDYEAAITELYGVLREDPGFTEAYQVLGDLFRLRGDYRNAVENYRKVLESDPGFPAPTRYGLGLSLYQLGHYGPAREQFEACLATAGSNGEQVVRLRKYIASCRFAEKAVAAPVPFEPRNLGPAVNSVHDEYLPAVTVDGRTLIFTRKDEQGEDFYTSASGGAGPDIGAGAKPAAGSIGAEPIAGAGKDAGAGVSPVNRTSAENISWEPAVPLSPDINSPDYNEGAECISPDGQTLFFTICGKPGGLGSCDIYYSQLEGSRWTPPLNLGAPVNTPSWESQPSLSPDGKTLYFASNRSGGLGGIDIWESTLREDGSWSRPVNLGPAVNTPYEEQSPFIHPDNQTLYFTSEGWPGMGGKDIFFSRKKDGKWQEAENIGYPVNTLKDESSLVVSADGRSAWFSSNSLEGFGGYDLYTFEMPEAARPQYVSYVRGRVYDAASGQALPARVEVIDLADGEMLFGSSSNAATGAFTASLPSGGNYAFHVSRPGYLFYSGSFFLENKPAAEPFALDVPLKKIAPGEKIILQNIFFDTDSFHLKPESYAELDKVVAFMKQNPEIVIELSGHTDDQGTEAYNLELSGVRAKAVYAYLVRAIPDPGRFRTKGYGESQPVAGNDTEEGRAQNRRTELKILSQNAE